MLHKSMLGLPMLLLGASCVPPLAAGQGMARAGDSSPARAAVASRAGVVPLPPPEAIAPGHAAEPFVLGERSERDVAASLECLTAAVYHEARSESSEGQRAVAQVVLNRVRHPAFPKTVCGVVYQGSNRRTGCQFSFTCDGSLGSRREPEAWARARKVAAGALRGSVYGPAGLATHYHADYVRPWWAASMRHAVTVGSHIFYRWRGDWGDPQSYRRPYLAAEVAERPDSPERAEPRLAAVKEEPEKAEVTRVFGVTIRRGGPPPRILAAAVRDPAEPAAAGGVRIHSGLPDFAMARPAEPEPVEPVAVALR